MVKQHVNLSIDTELIEEARKNNLNVSNIVEEKIRESLEIKKVVVDTKIDKCEFCGREQEKAKIDRSGFKEKYITGLTWLWPDERWICTSCLYSRSIHPAKTNKWAAADHETSSKTSAIF